MRGGCIRNSRECLSSPLARRGSEGSGERKGRERVRKEREGGVGTSNETKWCTRAITSTRERMTFQVASYVHSADRPPRLPGNPGRRGGGRRKRASRRLMKFRSSAGVRWIRARLIRQIHGHIIRTDERKSYSAARHRLTAYVLNMPVFPSTHRYL